MRERSDQPLVSVLVPTYEQEADALRAVCSALDQDYPNLEVVLVDDASPHARYAAVRAIADPRLRVVRNTRNLGRVGNYRRALYELARGEWVVNLDGDDQFIDRLFVSAAIAAADDPRTLIVAARCWAETDRGRTLSSGPGVTSMRGLDLVAGLPDSRLFFMHLATLYRRAPACRLDFYRHPGLSSDWESLYRLAAHGKVAFIDRAVGVWRVHGENASRSRDWRVWAQNLGIWPAVFGEARRAGLDEARAAAACRRCMVHFGRLQLPSVMRSHERAAAYRYLREIARMDSRALLETLASPLVWVRLIAGQFGYYRRSRF